MRRIITLTLLLAASVIEMQAQTAKNVVLKKDGTFLYVKMDLDLQSAKPRANEAVVVVPQVKNGSWVADLQPVGLYSHNMWYNFARKGKNASGDVNELQFRGHAPETVEYETRIPYQNWMNGASLVVLYLTDNVRETGSKKNTLLYYQQQGKPVIIQGDGSSLWHLTYNSDFAIGYTGLVGNRHAIGEAFQITGDETLTWNQIYQTIADKLGVELNAYHVSSDYLSAVGDKYGFDFEGSLTGDKSVSVVFDNSKLKRVVPDMKTTIRFDQGVKISLDYVLSHPECQVEDPEFDEWCDKVIAALEESKKNI